MPVSDKMKTALRRTAGLQSSGSAPFNAASQGGYRNMAKQISGGAKISPRGMARAQQGVGSSVRGAPITADDTTREAAGQALQRLSTGPAATDAMAGRGMGGTAQPSPPVYRSGAAAGQLQAASPMVDRWQSLSGDTGGIGTINTGAAAGQLQATSPMVDRWQSTTSLPLVPEIDTSMTMQLSGDTGGIGTINTGAAAGQLQAPGRFGKFETELAAANIGSLLGQGPQYTGPADENFGLPGLDVDGDTLVSASTGEPINVDRGASGFTGQASPQSTEAMVEGAIRDLLMGSVRDTTSEENLVREMMQAQQQQALVDQRARAGRAGLVQTGAQAGIESDIRQRAAQQALRDIMGIQAEARGEQRADIGLAGQLYGMDKAIAAEEARTTALLQALQAMYGQGDEPSTYGPGSPGYFNQSPIQGSEKVASPYGTPLDAPPEGGRLLGEVEYNGVVYDEYLGADGTSYLVNKTSSTPTAAITGNRRPFPRG